jgi:hypothetical protein
MQNKLYVGDGVLQEQKQYFPIESLSPPLLV